MSNDSANPKVAQQSALLGHIDQVCDRFESEWKSGGCPEIDDYVGAYSADDSLGSRCQLLIELVMIDLEYRWRRAAQGSADLSDASAGRLGLGPLPVRPRLDDYVDRYPELAPVHLLPDDLVALERYVRNRWGGLPGTRYAPGVYANEFQGSDRFMLARRIGAGGMGVVYEAFDQDREEAVAIKTMRNIEATAIYRLKREFRSLVDLDHRNLVALHELFSIDGEWFFTMELVDGVDVLSYVRFGPKMPAEPNGGLGADSITPNRYPDYEPVHETEKVLAHPWEETVGEGVADALLRPSQLNRLRKVLRQVAEGVNALHDAQKLHRDIKPSNVLVTPSGRVVLLDFGLTTELDPQGNNATTGVNLVGTVPYMSPEQAARETLSPASDWYSVGVMLYEALSGRQPFTGNVLDVLTAKQQEDPPPPSSLTAGIPVDLDRLCVELIGRDPDSRPCGSEVLGQLDSADRLRARASAMRADCSQDSPPDEHQEHLAALHDSFRAMQRGRTVAAYVCGPAGAGKRALVDHFLDQIRRREETVVLSGRCYQCDSVPYRGLDELVDSLSHYLAGLPRLEADALMPRDVIELSQIFPVLPRVEAVAQSRRWDLDTPNRRELRHRAFAGLRELLARLGDRKALVLAIDDLQWSDLRSLVLLRRLLRPPDPPVMLLVLSYHTDDESSSRVIRAIAQLGQATSQHIDVCEIEVDPAAV